MAFDTVPPTAGEYPYRTKETMLEAAELYWDTGFRVEIMPRDYMFPCYVIRVHNKA